MILVCYDGSADAQAAVDHAARLMGDAEATVLTIWEPFLDAMIRSGALGMSIGGTSQYADDEKIDALSREAALGKATEGAERAIAAGLQAQPRIASGHGGVPEAILTMAADLEADAVVLGTRGLGGIKSFLLGSVSHAVIQHADRSVLVVPSIRLAAERQHWAGRAEGTGVGA